MNLSSEVSAMFSSPMPSLNIRSLPFVVFLGGFPSRCQNLSSGAIRPGGLLFCVCLNLAIFHTNSPLFRPWLKFLVKVLYGVTLIYHCLSLVELYFCDKHKLFGFYLECICRYIALVDCICMEDV